MGQELAVQNKTDIDRALIKQIAMDIGKDVVLYVETMYPQAIAATSSTFKLSLRNCIYNEIMAAIETSEAEKMAKRLEEREIWRRKYKAMWKKNRQAATASQE